MQFLDEADNGSFMQGFFTNVKIDFVVRSKYGLACFLQVEEIRRAINQIGQYLEKIKRNNNVMLETLTHEGKVDISMDRCVSCMASQLRRERTKI